MNRFFLRHQKAIIWTVVVGFLLGGIGLFSFQRFSPPPQGSAEEAMLVVAGRSITRAELGQAYDNLVQYYTQLYQSFGQDFTTQLRGTAGAFNRHRFRAQAAESLIRQVLLDREARQLGITVPQAELEEAVSSRYQQVLERFDGDEESLRNYLSAQGVSLEEYRQSLRSSEEARLREERLRQQVVGPIEPTQDDLLPYYQQHQDRYQSEPEKIKLSYVQLDDAELADQLLAAAQGGDAPLEVLAEQHAQAGAEYGETDWFARGGSELPAEVEDAAFALQPENTTLVDAAGDYYLVRLVDRRPAVVPPLADIEDQVEEDYVRDQESRRWTDWYQRVRQGAEVDVRDPLLKAFMVYPEDPKEGADILAAARQEGKVSDLYVDYYLGRVYEELYMDAGERRAELAGADELTADQQAELERVTEQEREYKERAIAAYLAFAETGEGDEAFLQRAASLAPDDPQIHYRLAELYRERCLYVQADREYQQALDANPQFAAALIGQGDTAMQMQLYGRAVDRYQAALELQTGSARIQLKLAEAFLKDGQLEQCRPLLEEVLAQDPDSASAQLLMGDLLLAQGDAPGAIDHYQQVVRSNPTSEVQLKLARAYAAAGQLEEARDRYEDLTRQFPYRGAAYEGLGDVLRQLGQPERALEQYRQALPRTFESADKERIAEKIIQLAPEDLETRFKLANYYQESYKYDAAIRQYEEILARDPGNPDALIGLGDCYVPKTEYDTAMEFYRRALEAVEVPQRKLLVYDKMVMCEERRAGTQGELSPASLEALWQRALLHRQLGDEDKAKEDLQRIHDADPSFRAGELVPLLVELGGEVQTPAQTPSEAPAEEE
ncbi:MAG: tetratricopeptide repeat protein [Candidatus Bipolaricaulaceae bacterium]